MKWVKNVENWKCYFFGHCTKEGLHDDYYEICDRCGLHSAYHSEQNKGYYINEYPFYDDYPFWGKRWFKFKCEVNDLIEKVKDKFKKHTPLSKDDLPF